MQELRSSDVFEVAVGGSRILRIPRHFNRYECIKSLGTGASSVVILVRHVISASLYACKIVSREYLVAEDIFCRFEQEVRLLPSLIHPNIVRFEEILFDPEFIYVVMEYCSQGDLFSHLVSNGVFPEPRARDIFRQISDAVHFIHERDIVHRDLKPENVLLDKSFTAKLADFGLCHFVSPKALLRTPCGSPFYAPPEIITGQDYDGKSADIWSLGVLLFTIVTGSLPWTSDNQVQLFRQIREADIDIPETLSSSLRELLGNMLQRDPARRLTISEVLNSSWLPKQKGGRLRAYAKSSCWGKDGGDSIPFAPSMPIPMSMPTPGPGTLLRRWVIRPKKTAATIPGPSVRNFEIVPPMKAPLERNPTVSAAATWS
jgi:serine/threonine protein kinase